MAWLGIAAVISVLIAGGAFALWRRPSQPKLSTPTTTNGAAYLRNANVTNIPATASNAQAAGAHVSSAPSSVAVGTMEVAQAVMVTVELDFGPAVPTIAEALREIERRHQSEDGKGRVFAILDAYGQATPDGKLHMSMHVSTEKPGIGSLIFKRTGEVLWSSRIIPANAPSKRAFTGKDLIIHVDDGTGKLLTVVGTDNPSSILEAGVAEKGVLVAALWPDQSEREVTFIYSACGCPVKVRVKREGDRTVRTSDLPVIFPDDPAVVEVIARLMRW
jgi:hypothetical protein